MTAAKRARAGAGTTSNAMREWIRALLLMGCGIGASASLQAGGSVAAMDAAPAPVAPTTDRLIVHYRDASASTIVDGQPSVQAKAVNPERMVARVAQAKRLAAAAGANARLLRQTGLGSHVFKLDRALSLAALRRLAARMKAQDPAIEYAEPDLPMVAMFTPNDTYYRSQWDLFEPTGGIGAPAAWDIATGSGVVVAVLDTGIRPHVDLAGQTVAGYDMITNTPTAADGNGRDADPSDPGDWVAAGQCPDSPQAADSSWHGTHVAGTIAAKTHNAAGISGIAFNARIQPVRVLGKCIGYTSDIADGIVWAAGGSVPNAPANATPARVINLSLGRKGACDTTTQAAINVARSRGTTVVVAAGNSNANASGYSPVSCAGVVAVAAADRFGTRAYYSNFGSAIAVSAPGGDARSSAANAIYSTFNMGRTVPAADGYAYYQGTSMAAPHVSGVVALMLSVRPGATPDQIAAALKAGTRPFPGVCAQCGTGLLDAAGALKAIMAPPPPPPLRSANEVEANNAPSTANWAQSPLIVNGNLSATDTDFFRVDLPTGKSLAATLSMGAPSTDYNLYYYDTGGWIIARSEKGAGQVDSLAYLNTGTAPVTLYVRVYYHATSGGSGNYALKLQW